MLQRFFTFINAPMHLRSNAKSGEAAKEFERLQPNLNPPTPTQLACSSKRQRFPTSLLDCFCDEILLHIIQEISDPAHLCALACASHRFMHLVDSSDHWQGLWAQAFGDVTAVTVDAAELAGGWKPLYAERYKLRLGTAPWEKASEFEVQAAVRRMLLDFNAPPSKCDLQSITPQSQETAVVFLIDGSGSVTEEDFSCMTSFLFRTISMMEPSPCEDDFNTATSGMLNPPVIRVPSSGIHLGIVQFSNEVHVEVEVTPVENNIDQVYRAANALMRMNGGTNIALAIQKAGQMLKKMPSGCRRVLALLSDGRIDSYQSREACQMLSRLSDEQSRVEFHAFGVGRGVDRHELQKIVAAAATDASKAADRFLPLMVMEDAAW